MRRPTIVYLQSGTMGDYLMSLHFADQVWQGAKLQNKTCPIVIIALRRNTQFLRPLASGYKHVKVVSLEKGHILAGVREILSHKSPRLVITWPTLGWVPLRLKILGRLLAGARGSMVGFDDGSTVNRMLYKERWLFNRDQPMHTSMCQLAGRLGYETPCTLPRLRFTLDRVLSKPYLLFHIFPAEPSRTWPAERWNEFLQVVRQRWPEVPFVFTGAPSDCKFIDEAVKGISHSESKCGKLTAQQLVEVIDRATLFIGVDTGTAHLAAFRQKYSVVVGTRRTPFWWATYSPKTKWLAAPCSCGPKGDCRVRNADGVSRFRCTTGILNSEVLDAMAAFLVQIQQ